MDKGHGAKEVLQHQIHGSQVQSQHREEGKKVDKRGKLGFKNLAVLTELFTNNGKPNQGDPNRSPGSTEAQPGWLRRNLCDYRNYNLPALQATQTFTFPTHQAAPREYLSEPSKVTYLGEVLRTVHL